MVATKRALKPTEPILPVSCWKRAIRYTGSKPRSSSFNTRRIEDIYQDPHEQNPRLDLHYGELTDSTNLIRIMQETRLP